MTSPTLWHLALEEHWRAALRSGRYEWSTVGLTLAQQGYVHASTARQVDGVARRFYADVGAPLVLLELDVAALESTGSPVRWEEVPGSPEPFPHVYGPVPVHAVLSVTPFEVGDRVPAPGTG